MCKAFRQIALLAFLCNSVSSCYVSKLAYHHFKFTAGRKPIAEIIEEEKADRTTLNKLRLVQDVLSFADKQGFNSKDAYIYYVETPSNALSYIVQAAPKNELSLKTWWFPIVGKVPYLGFYSLEDCREEAESLKKEGYDVNISGVGAYSSLGWFSDPIFSPMLNRNPEFIAELLFHELTHRTIWISDSVEFNEQLADFISYQAVKKFLNERNEIKLLKNIDLQHADQQLFRSWLKELKDRLTKLYASANKHSQNHHEKEKDELLRSKKLIFDEFLSSPKRPQFKMTDFIGRRHTWNNATVMASALYNENAESFQKVFDCMEEPKLETFLEQLKKISQKSTSEPQNALQELCK